MKKKNPWLMLFVLLVVFGVILAAGISWNMKSFFNQRGFAVGTKSILHLQLSGVIMDGKKVLKPLLKYREDKSIKAVVIEINSPGGVVGPSQELYEEIRRTREEFKLPVVAVTTNVMASGAYYAAVGADKIIAAPGSMVGSIGVIMQFTNLEKLYDWAKVSRFSIATGKFKDSGAEYRPMRDDERALFQELIDDVYAQFVEAIAEGRNMKPEAVKPYADGRVFTGRQGVDYGFVDELGTLEDAFDVAADLAGLSDYDIFEPPKERPSIWDLMGSADEETTILPWKPSSQQIEKAMKSLFRLELANKPLLLMPGVY